MVLLQVSTAKSDVSGHLQQLPHAERGALALEKSTAQFNALYAHLISHIQRGRWGVHLQLVACSASGSSSCLLQSSAPAGWNGAGCSDWLRCSGLCFHDWICCKHKQQTVRLAGLSFTLPNSAIWTLMWGISTIKIDSHCLQKRWWQMTEHFCNCPLNLQIQLNNADYDPDISVCSTGAETEI